MKDKETYYSHTELLGGEATPESFWTERYYSETEVEMISDLFEEFYSENSEFYSDVDEAYSEFIDVYSTSTIILDDNKTQKEPNVDASKPARFKLSKKQTKVATTTVGAGAGYGVARLMTSKLRSKIKNIETKVQSGHATRDEYKSLQGLKSKLNNITSGATIAGAGVGYGTAHYLGSKK